MPEPPASDPQLKKPAAPAVPKFSLDRAAQTLLQPIVLRLAKLESLLAADGREIRVAGEKAAPPSPPRVQGGSVLDASCEAAATAVLGADLFERLTNLEAAVTGLGQKIDSLADHAVAEPPPAPEVFWGERIHPNEDWPRIVLGDELCDDAYLEAPRREFLADVTGGSQAARALAGQLMLIQAAPVEQLPELLRYVGEAFYRWRAGKTADDDPLEHAMVQWLNRLVAAAGLPNSIQRVRRGERFDSSRHSANGRGNEVVAVHGWVVLRDHSRVYTKAGVSVK